MSTKRRQFLKQMALLGTMASSGSVAAAAAVAAVAGENAGSAAEDKGLTILFQGDSITDGNRSRNTDWNHIMGHGYQYIVASKLWYEFPRRGYHFFNRGISGNKVTDLAARWQQDALDIKPDLLSILIGINDVSAFLGGNNDFTFANYESVYAKLLDRTKSQLPGVTLVLCEPFVLPVGKIKDKWQEYDSEVKKRQEVVKKLAARYNAIHVPFQSAFEKALSKAPAEYWIWDGIHPMPAGHELMARDWLQQVGKRYKNIK